MLEIGTELARRSGDGPAAIRIVGVLEGRPNKYNVAPVPFGVVTSYTAEELALLYGASDAEIVIVSEADSWRALSSRAVRDVNVELIDLEAAQAELLSPEQHFAAVAAAEADKPSRKLRRARS